MSQKSLPTLNKVDTSMIWYSTFFCKNYKWLSSQYIYFTNYLLKLIFFIDFFFTNTMWVYYEKDKLLVNYVNRKKKFKLKKLEYTEIIATYMVTFPKRILLINLYYISSLRRLQESIYKKKTIKSYQPHIRTNQLEFIYECT